MFKSKKKVPRKPSVKERRLLNENEKLRQMVDLMLVTQDTFDLEPLKARILTQSSPK